MFYKRIFLSFLLIVSLSKIQAVPMIIAPSSQSEDKSKITWAQICSCKSYYGVPHTCYYSSVSDPDYSCISKCIREANQ